MAVWFIFFHITMMVMGVGVSVGSELLLHRIAQTRDVRAIRTAFVLAKPLGTAPQVLFVFGMIFGLIAAFLGQFNLFAPWLLIAYVLLAIVLLVAGALIVPWSQRIAMAAASSGDAPSKELERLIKDQTARNAMWGTIGLIVLILFDMVIKPGGV